MTDLNCPCTSGKKYKECCQRFHEGEKAENALMLMRSRFAAYALNIPDYIIRTTHPSSPQYSKNKFNWKRSISQFSKNTLFKKLEVHDFQENKTFATVTFTAYLEQNAQDTTFTERSIFEKIEGTWLYRSGELAEGRSLKLVTPLKLLPLAYYGDPILRKKGNPIIAITPEIKTLVDNMIETMDACDGAGLAAPQVHHSLRLFVMRRVTETEPGKYESGDVEVFINPNLSLHSEEMGKEEEGCLSITDFYGTVERPLSVTVEYTTLEGKDVKQTFTGWEARVIQHENDHIEGVLFIDRLDQESLAKWKKENKK